MKKNSTPSRASNRQKRPVPGAGALFEGFRFLWRPGLKRFLLVPLAVNIVVFSLLAWIGYSQSEHFFNRFLPVESWLGYFRWILWPLFAAAYLLVLFYSFTMVANLIAAPFNGLLSGRVEEILTGARPPDMPGHWASDILPSLFSELRKLLYFLTRALPLLLLFLIPGIQLAAPLLWALFAAWFLALEYLDYPMSNHGLKFKQQTGILKKNRFQVLGFGGAITLLMLIPVLNLAVMPAAVAGATIYWCRHPAREDHD